MCSIGTLFQEASTVVQAQGKRDQNLLDTKHQSSKSVGSHASPAPSRVAEHGVPNTLQLLVSHSLSITS